MKKNVVPVLLVLFMIGCFGSQTAKRYYQIQIPTPVNTEKNMIDRVIYIESVYTEDLYDDFRLVYRISPYQINYYAYDFWVKKPGAMLKNSVADFFRRSGFFRQVIDRLADSEPELIFKSKLYVIEEDDSGSQWTARLAMEIEISDFKNPQKIFLFYRFDRKKNLPAKNVNQLPEVISEILREELVTVVNRLADQLN